MKIAIQGHPTRGKEIISLLESFGGIKSTLKGDGELYTYYIDKNNVIRYDAAPKDYKVYTLEEFEKEFPFKIGDKVIYSYTPNLIGTVVDIKFNDNIPYRVDIEGTICTCGTNMLKSYKEMKEERNITLTLAKAKEWYNKGGELREIALQAFNEKELTKVELPKTWEEYIQQNFHREGYVLTHLGSIAETEITGLRGGENLCPSKQSAEAHLAMIQLEQLRNCWRNSWEPNWNDFQQTKYCVVYYRGEFKIKTLYEARNFLSFPTIKIAEEFFKCFRDLIEKAGDLI